MRIIDERQEEQETHSVDDEGVDLIEILTTLQEEHRNVFMIQLEGITFIYRSLGRAEYKNLLMQDDLTELEKQDIICESCVLWPTDFDFDNCSAGLPSVLHKKILKNSFLDSIESRQSVLNYYRQDMFALESQIACIINEAFPNLDIEDIERWDTEQTMKYLSRAEWKLANLRGMPFVDSTGAAESFYPQPIEKEEAPAEEEKKETSKDGRPKMTPDALRELQEFQRKFPEFAGKGETILDEGITGMASGAVDTLTPGLRPGT